MPKFTGWIIAAVTLVGVAACSDKAANQNAESVAADQATAKPLGSSWSDIGKMPDFFTGNWQSVSSMVDGPIEVGYTDPGHIRLFPNDRRGIVPQTANAIVSMFFHSSATPSSACALQASGSGVSRRSECVIGCQVENLQEERVALDRRL